MILNPPLATLAPKAVQIMRIGLRVPNATVSEASSRLIVEEVPTAKPESKRFGNQHDFAHELSEICRTEMRFAVSILRGSSIWRSLTFIRRRPWQKTSKSSQRPLWLRSRRRPCGAWWVICPAMITCFSDWT